MNCKKCNSECIEFKGRYICSNENCDFTVVISTLTRSGPWFEQIVEDESLWVKSAFEVYPSIIAHEYWRIYQLLKEGHTYGAFLQLKDLFEVLIKFPTLVAVSELNEKTEKTKKENEILADLLSKPLGLGDWERIASALVKHTSVNQKVKKWLTSCLTLFKDHSITNWRNDNLGHGALFFDHDPQFKKDFSKRIAIVKQHFDEHDKLYRDIHFYATINGTDQVLRGREHASNLYSKKIDLYIVLEDVRVSLFPFVILDKQGIYFFDSYFSKKNKTATLNYPEGIKDDLNRTVHMELYRIYSSLTHYTHSFESTFSVEDETYSRKQADILNKLQEVDDFQSPAHLKKWVEQITFTYDKGIFLLQMERGTGKTTFARALDELSLHKIKIDDFSIRSYYINDSFLHESKNFTIRVNDLLRKDRKGQIEIEGIQAITGNEENVKRAFAAFLEKYQRAHKNHFNRDHLLLILDGLDEIPSNDGTSIFDFIPDEKDLPKNVFILLTCRTDEEITDYTKSKLKKLTIKAQQSYTREDNLLTVETYITKKILNIQKENTKLNDFQIKQINKVISHADKRFLYVKPIKEILKMNPTMDLNEIPTGNQILPYYLENLRKHYGEKYFKKVKTILSILATSYDGLTYKEISYLFGEDKPSFEFLAYLVDIRSFLHLDRDSRGNLIQISHQEYKDQILSDCLLEIKELVNHWTDLISSDFVQFEVDHVGELYLNSTIFNYVKDFSPENKAKLLEISTLEKLYKFCEDVYHQPYTDVYYTRILSLLAHLVTVSTSISDTITVKALSLGGMILFDLKEYERSTEILTTALEKIENSPNPLLAEKVPVLMGLGNCLSKKHLPERSLYFHLQAFELFEQLDDHIEHFHYFLPHLNNTALSLKYLKQFDEALYLITIIIDTCKPEDELDMDSQTLNLLATAYRNRASIFLESNHYQDAINDYNESIQIREALVKENSAKYKPDLANAYSGRADAYALDDQDEKSILDYNQSIKLREELYESSKLKNPMNLAYDYSNRGKLYKNKNNYTFSANDFTHAIGIIERLIEQERELSHEEIENIYLEAYLLRSDCHKKMGIDYFTDLYKIVEIYKESNKMFPVLAVKAYNRLGTDLSESSTKLAIAYLHEAETILITLRKKDINKNVNDYIANLFSLVFAYFYDKNDKTSVKYLIKLLMAIQIHLKKHPEVFDKYFHTAQNLAVAFNQKGINPSDLKKIRKLVIDIVKKYAEVSNQRYKRTGSLIGIVNNDSN
ncbi:hypothetical protein [Ferdinandcohnia sp. Marseille-Q9671]